MLRTALIHVVRGISGLGLAALLLATPGCLVRKVTHIPNRGPAPPTLTATPAELVAKIDAWSSSVRTLTATVDLQPTAGSVYSGVIKEYHDVKGFVLYFGPQSVLYYMGLRPLQQQNLILPATVITTFDPPFCKMLKPICDALWRSCGLQQSFNFDKDESWVGKEWL